MKRIIISAVCLILLPLLTIAHGSGNVHVREMYSVLPFAVQSNGNPEAKNQPVVDWLGMITSDLIDNYWGKECPEFGGKTFYDYLRDEYGFRCKHRLLFHWGFNSRPWSDDLEKKISGYQWYSDKDMVEKFKNAFVIEQARRNRQANRATEELFGFSSSGKEATWANGILAIVYDVHLLGDWTPEDNSDFDGVSTPSQITGDLINSLRRIDPKASQSLVRKLNNLSRSVHDEHQKAVKMIALLQEDLPKFLLDANNGALRKKFESKGYILRR